MAPFEPPSSLRPLHLPIYSFERVSSDLESAPLLGGSPAKWVQGRSDARIHVSPELMRMNRAVVETFLIDINNGKLVEINRIKFTI